MYHIADSTTVAARKLLQACSELCDYPHRNSNLVHYIEEATVPDNCIWSVLFACV